MANDFKQTMNLPQTEFPMRANLAAREPEWLAYWDEIDVYQRVARDAREAPSRSSCTTVRRTRTATSTWAPAYNKVLKDLIVKYKSMRGYCAPYVPGWDCHGQPIEHQVEKKLGPEKMAKISQAKLRELCRDWAMEFVDVQREEFKRLGVRGDWDEPVPDAQPQLRGRRRQGLREDVRARRDLQGPQADPLVQALPHGSG